MNNSFKNQKKKKKELNEIVKDHVYEKSIINLEKIKLDEFKTIYLKKLIKEYINKVIEEYSKEKSYERDLNFALNLSSNILMFIFDTVEEMSMENSANFSFVF